MKPTQKMPSMLIVELEGKKSIFTFATRAQAKKNMETLKEVFPAIKCSIVTSIKKRKKK